MSQEERDLKMYCFEQAIHILENSIVAFTKDNIDELFKLSERIYKYLDTGKDASE